MARELHRRLVVNPARFYSWSTLHPESGRRHKKQLRFLLAMHQIAVSIGANRTGKTEAVTYICACELMGWSPELTRHYGRLIVYEGQQRIWMVSEDFDVAERTVMRGIRELIPPEESKSKRVVFKASTRTWTRAGIESYLGFKSVKEGRASFQGTSMTRIAFDEEPRDQAVYDECYVRTLDCMGRIAFAFTAVDGSKWLHTLLNDPKQDLFRISMGMVDNPYLPDDVIEKAKRRYKGDDLRIRVFGEYILRYGRPYFDQDSLIAQREAFSVDVDDPDLRVENTNDVKAGKNYWRGKVIWSKTHRPRLVALEEGKLTIFRMPRHDRTYVIASDSSGGHPEGDFSCAQILDVHSHEQVAVWHGHISPSEFGYVLEKLGYLFNNALIAPEVNWHGSVTLFVLHETVQYGNLYIRQKFDRRPQNWKPSSDGVKSLNLLGWYTSKGTKPLMCGLLRDHLQGEHIVIRDQATLEEMGAFGYTDEQSNAYGLGALSGHDDRVDALAIAIMCLDQAPRFMSIPEEPDEEIGAVLAAMAVETRGDVGNEGLDDDGFPADDFDSDPFDMF